MSNQEVVCPLSRQTLKLVAAAILLAVICASGYFVLRDNPNAPKGESPEVDFAAPGVTPSQAVDWNEFHKLLESGDFADCIRAESLGSKRNLPILKHQPMTQNMIDNPYRHLASENFGGGDNLTVRYVTDGNAYAEIDTQCGPAFVHKRSLEKLEGFSISVGSHEHGEGLLGPKTGILCLTMDECNKDSIVKRWNFSGTQRTETKQPLPVKQQDPEHKYYPAILVFDWRDGNLLDVIYPPLKTHRSLLVLSSDERHLYLKTSKGWVRKFKLPSTESSRSN